MAKKKIKSLVSLAKKGSLEDFRACLHDHPKPVPDDVLFSALRNALAWNQPQKVQWLLEAGANPLATNEENAQLLSHAAISGSGKLVKLMLSLDCDVNHKNIHNRTALHEAARFGNIEGVRALVDAGADLNCRDTRHQTPLMEAISNNHPETAIELICNGADVHTCLSPQQETPLMLAAARKSKALVLLLLEKGSDIESRDFIGCTPLMHAARSGTPEIVQLLLETGADREARDQKGLNALQWASSLRPEISLLLLGENVLPPGRAREALLKAASDGHVGMITTLLAQNASVQPRKEGGESALVRAVLQKSTEALELLLRYQQSDIDYRYGKLLQTPLMVAARLGDTAKVRLLLEAGANHAITDVDDRRAVNYAAIAADMKTLALLKQHSASLLHRDAAGRTLLHQAIYDTASSAADVSRNETVKWLLEQNLDPNAADNSGMTPLMLAAAHARTDIVKMLLEKGSVVDTEDEARRTALVHALYYGTDYGYEDRYTKPKSEEADRAAPVIRMLLDAGADPDRHDATAIAHRWRWPGAGALLKHFSVKKKPGCHL